MITTVLAFVLTLGVLIVVHEWGHYRVAVACGVKVLRFSVGFGRVLWRYQRHPDSTEFVLCALPLGGYVRMLDEREDTVAAQDLHRSFNRKPLRHRVAIVSAGPLANLVLAVLLYAAAGWVGVKEPKAVLSTPPTPSLADAGGLRSGDWVRAVARDRAGQAPEWQDVASMNDLRWQITQAALDGQALRLSVTDRQGQRPREHVLALQTLLVRDVDAVLMRQIGLAPAYSEPRLGEVRPDGAAQAAGLRQGDLVLAVDGVATQDAQQLRERIRAAAPSGAGSAEPASQRWQIQRADVSGAVATMELLVTPRVVVEGQQRVARIGAFVGTAPEQVLVRQGPLNALMHGVERTWEVSMLTLRMLGRMLIGEASIKNLSGPLTIADFAGQSVQQGWVYYVGFLALVSVSLGVLNLLPLPMLDGGHLMYYLFEGITGRPVSEAWLARLQRGGVAILLVMMSVALFNDVARLLGLH
jgi:regulator of sigma E protease